MDTPLPHPDHRHCPSQQEFLFLPHVSQSSFVRLDHVAYLKGDKNVTWVYTTHPVTDMIEQKPEILTHNLNHYAQQLPPCFARIGKSLIVNMAKVVVYDSEKGFLLTCGNIESLFLSPIYALRHPLLLPFAKAVKRPPKKRS